MSWDFEFTDDESGISYRVKAKTFTVRDGLACSNEQDMIIRDYEGRELLELSNYPVLKYGTDTAEFAVDGKEWQTLPMNTPDDYLNLPEFVAYGWQQAIFQRNPQRWDGYEKLKNSLAALGHPTKTPLISESESVENATPSASLNA